MAQQLRKATPWGEVPGYVIRDKDSEYGQRYTTAASSAGTAGRCWIT